MPLIFYISKINFKKIIFWLRWVYYINDKISFFVCILKHAKICEKLFKIFGYVRLFFTLEYWNHTKNGYRKKLVMKSDTNSYFQNPHLRTWRSSASSDHWDKWVGKHEFILLSLWDNYIHIILKGESWENGIGVV